MVDLEEYLSKLDLTKYEARVLASLIRQKTATASRIANISRVPRTRIYDVISRLIQRGWVVERPGRPSTYEVVNPKALLKNRIGKVREELDQVESEVSKIIDEVEKKQESKITETSELILGTENSINSIRSLLLGTKKSVIIDEVPMAFISSFMSELNELKRREIEVRLISRYEDAQLARKFRKIAKVRVIARPVRKHSGLIIIDDSFMHVYFSGSRVDCAKILVPICIPCIRNQMKELWDTATSI